MLKSISVFILIISTYYYCYPTNSNIYKDNHAIKKKYKKIHNRENIRDSSEDKIHNIINTYIESYNFSEENNMGNIEEYIEDFVQLYYKTININSASITDFRRIFFLSDWQIEGILRYRDTYGRILTIHELKYIKELDAKTISLLQYIIGFEELKEVGFENIWKFTKHNLLMRYGRQLKLSRGYKENIYLGSPDKYYIRYRFSASNKINFGFAAEKDAGEEFFKGSNKLGFDSYAAFFSVKNIGPIQHWVIGRYTLGFGYGLNIGRFSIFSSISNTDLINRTNVPIRDFASSAEMGFFNGSAISLKLGGKVDLNMFYSNRLNDGSVQYYKNDDQSVEEYINTLSETGYHRTINEIKKEKNIREQVFGINSEIHLKKIKLGGLINFSNLKWAEPRKSSLQINGDKIFTENINASIYYQSIINKIHIYGEYASCINNLKMNKPNFGFAFVQGLQLKLHPTFNIHFIGYFTNKYTSLYGNRTARSSIKRNEFGLNIISSISMYKGLKLNSYIDFNKNYDLVLPREFPSFSKRYELQLMFENKYVNTYLAYKYKETIKPEHSLKLYFRKTLRRNLKLTSIIETKNIYKAYLLSQDIAYKFESIGLEISLRYALFNTEKHGIPFYLYETDLLYSAEIPPLSGSGHRFYIVFKYRISKNLRIELKYRQSILDNINTIGSGYDIIKGNIKPEIKTQIILKL